MDLPDYNNLYDTSEFSKSISILTMNNMNNKLLSYGAVEVEKPKTERPVYHYNGQYMTTKCPNPNDDWVYYQFKTLDSLGQNVGPCPIEDIDYFEAWPRHCL